ncbi:nephrin-like [Panulirus ornatus]|uniref:nephrin-like n=1 Tax=Panulirus ornatus TaxID=150431 RepID=UPI003A8AD36D
MSRRYVAEIVMTSFVWATAAATTKDPAVVRSVWVVRGGRAELPCAPTPKHKQDSAVLVLWYRSSDTVPVYSYDARESEFTSGVPWADEGTLGGRAHFMPKSEPPTLVLEPAHARDQGMYTCRVDYRLSPSTTVIFNLTVVIPPGPPTILWGGRGIVAVVGPLGEGERAELTCRSVGGRPPPTLTWTRRGRQLPLLKNESVTDPGTGTTQVEAVVAIMGSREHLGSTLSCHARTPSTTPPDLVPFQTASVVVNVTLAPVEVRILGSGTAVTAGTDLRLVCRAAGSHPPAHLVWWRGHIRLPNVTHAIADGGNVSTATLTLRVDRSYNGVTLACTASNPALPHAQRLTDTVKLNVFYPPAVHLSLGRPLDPDSIKEGDDVYFECSIVSNPAFHRVDWHHNGLLVAPNVSSGVVVSGLSLVLRHLRRQHSGSYTCGASNLEGYNTSNVVTLSVRHVRVTDVANAVKEVAMVSMCTSQLCCGSFDLKYIASIV